MQIAARDRYRTAVLLKPTSDYLNYLASGSYVDKIPSKFVTATRKNKQKANRHYTKAFLTEALCCWLFYLLFDTSSFVFKPVFLKLKTLKFLCHENGRIKK